jgi:hypothetical protein
LPTDRDYTVSIDLNVLNHLGINLYSNIPAVLSEVVANSWDADARNVYITVDDPSIIIEDDGCGMTKDEINEKYLTVGYQRRKAGEVTQSLRREIMGRKGIGKLSLFSIADVVEVRSRKNGEKAGCILDVTDIKKAIEAKPRQDYHPIPISADDNDLDEDGTKIVIKGLKKDFAKTPYYLKRRIARRFGILGEKHDFNVEINGEKVGIADREYFHKLQFIWCYGDHEDVETYLKYSRNGGNEVECQREKSKKHSVVRVGDQEYPVTGWIGTVRSQGDLKDKEADENLNKIVIMARGKLAQEDILTEFAEGGIYSKYLIGEINADFLDSTELEDIVTSNRQEIRKIDPRYEALKNWVYDELKAIQDTWSDLRSKQATKEALRIEPVKKWFKQLNRDQAKYAETLLFAKIETIGVDDIERKKLLYKHGIIAFESLWARDNLTKLEAVSSDNFQEFINLFEIQDDIEAASYYQIVKGRVSMIEKLQSMVKADEKERAIQEHIKNDLWLLDTHWDRATTNPHYEERVTTEFKKIDADLSDEEKLGRIDIRYKQSAGKHIIVELKRASVSVSSTKLMEQVLKYKRALAKVLEAAQEKNPPIEVVCILGKKCSDWTNDLEEQRWSKSLQAHNIRVVTYDRLIANAYENYENFLEKKKEIGTRLEGIFQDIDAL